MSVKKNLLISFIVLFFTIMLFQFTNIDESVQNHFYDFQHHKWILDSDAQPYRFVFYDGLKKLLIFTGILFLIAFFMDKFKKYKKGIAIVILSAITVPVTIGFLKKVTNMPCPKHRIEYGGEYPKTYLWQHYPKNLHLRRVKCWPAGHASGGFALMSLFFLFKRRKNRIIGLIIGLAVGWISGIYKMLIGDHFLSHTVITMIIAWILILINALTVDCFFNKKS